MLSIGIDVSKGKSTVCGMKPGGEIVYTPFEIQHTREGMSELVSLLRSSGEEVRAVLESTGSYHCPVVAALLENGIFVSVVNSLRMKRFCSQSIRKVKTDRIDAMQIALYGLAYSGASTDQTAGGYISGASASGAAVLPDDLPPYQGKGRF
ncbi:MAG: IS110 family transposase [Eubacteriales bacterium]